MAGNVYDRNTGDTRRRYNAPNWNPSWNPNNAANPRQIKGVITPAGSVTWGMLESATSLTDTGVVLLTAASAPGCAFAANTPANPINPSGSTSFVRDFAYMPDQDFYGNNTSGYMPNDVYPNGWTYAGKKRIDTQTGLMNAGMNASDSAATRIRNDVTLKPIIYTIGLGSNGGVDHNLLRRIANDPASPIYDNTLAPGSYAYAATNTDLNAAFVKIASEILRIAQ